MFTCQHNYLSITTPCLAFRLVLCPAESSIALACNRVDWTSGRRFATPPTGRLAVARALLLFEVEILEVVVLVVAVVVEVVRVDMEFWAISKHLLSSSIILALELDMVCSFLKCNKIIELALSLVSPSQLLSTSRVLLGKFVRNNQLVGVEGMGVYLQLDSC